MGLGNISKGVARIVSTEETSADSDCVKQDSECIGGSRHSNH